MAGVTSFEHIGGAPKDTIQLSGNIRSNASGEGLSSSENQSWNAQYRYMIAIADKIDYLSRHLLDAKGDPFYARRLLTELIGLWHLFLGSPKACDLKQETRKRIETRIATAEAYLELGNLEKEVDIIREVFVDILVQLRDGYTFKGSRAKVKIRSGIAGDMDDLVGRK
jgi:hypothetical protein